MNQFIKDQFTKEQQDRVQANFENLYDQSKAQMRETPHADARDRIHYTLWVSEDIDTTIWLWWGSLMAYCLIPEITESKYECSLKDYRERFCGGYIYPDEYLENVRIHLVAEITGRHTLSELKQMNGAKIIADATLQVSQRYHQIDTQWLSTVFRLPQLNPMDMCFFFKR